MTAIQFKSTIEGEEFRQIENTYYYISNYGRIFSNYNGRFRQLQPYKLHNYLAVSLKLGDKIVKRKIHRLVLEAFIGPCPVNYEGCHNDGNSLNNKLENLRWGTRESNFEDQKIHGSLIAVRGSDHGQAKLTEEKVKELKCKYLLGMKQVELAEYYGVSDATVSDILSRRIWKHV